MIDDDGQNRILASTPAFQQLIAKRLATRSPVRGEAVDEIEDSLTPESVDELLADDPSLDACIDYRPRFQTRLLQKGDYAVPFGPVFGQAGSQQTLTVSPQCYFRGEKLIATDSSPTPGAGTRINLFVGSKRQFPNNGGSGVLSIFFGHNALSSGMMMNTCQPAFNISMVVSFIVACTFTATLFGKAVL